MTKELSIFIDESGDFGEYDHHSPFYIITMVFNALLTNIDFRRVMPENYKLFQVADLLCTMELIKLKMEHGLFSSSEEKFFGSLRDLKRNYLKPLSKLEWI